MIDPVPCVSAPVLRLRSLTTDEPASFFFLLSLASSQLKIKKDNGHFYTSFFIAWTAGVFAITPPPPLAVAPVTQEDDMRWNPNDDGIVFNP